MIHIASTLLNTQQYVVDVQYGCIEHQASITTRFLVQDLMRVICKYAKGKQQQQQYLGSQLYI
jgi:hypothetical protein